MRRTRRGGVMVLALAVLVGMVAILAAAAASGRLAFRSTLNRTDAQRAQFAAESAASYLLATLASQSKTSTTLQDEWASLGDSGNERFVVGNDSFRIQVIDAASLLNVNTITQPQMEKLEWTTEQIDSLLDWREPGQTARPEGAKDEYYNTLPEPYNARLGKLTTVQELLLVRGFTPEILYGPPLEEQTNESQETLPLIELLTAESVSQDSDPNGQPKLNVNSQQTSVQTLIQRAQISANLAAAIVQRRGTQPFTSIGQVLQLPGVTSQNAANILDNLSTTGTARVEGKLNLNTVTQDALDAIPDLTPEQAQAILSKQSEGFTRLGELATVQSIDMQTLQRVADLFSVNSQVFTVRILAEAGAMQKAYEATISIEDTPKLLRLSEASVDAPVRWGWAEEPTSETVIVEAAA